MMIMLSIAAGLYIVSGVLTWKAVKNLNDEEYEVVIKALTENRHRDIF